MKTIIYCLRNATVAAMLLTLAFGQSLLAQDSPPTIYFEITKLKKSNDDLMDMEEELVKPFVQERIKQGSQLAHLLFWVHYPQSDDAAYDYVVVDIYDDFNDLHLGEKKVWEIANSAFPNADVPKMYERFKAAAKNARSAVYVSRDEAVAGPPQEGEVRKFFQVNTMKVSEANAGQYAALESGIFKPIHQARVKAGNMKEWLLLERIMPYGTEWDDNFLTIDIFENWADMGAGMGDLFEKVHPGKDANAIWEATAKLRDLRRQETWELISAVNKPTPEVTYQTVKEGAGPSPKKGHEVAFKVKMMDSEGKTLFTSEDLGFPFYATLGENLYDRFFDKGVMKMKKGGVQTITLPPDAQDKNTLAQSGGKNVVVKVELVDFGDPKPNGAALLEKKIEEGGLTAAREKYEKLQTSNPNGYVFREGPMNSLGYKLMGKGEHDAAIYIFELNQKNNPKSWNACDSLADGYRAKGDIAKAKHCYEMALKINPDFQASRDKLADL